MRHTPVAILLSSLLLSVSGCGGGGGTTTAAAPADTVSGVAAVGAALVGTVSLKDSAATPKELSKTSSNGTFSFDVTGMTKPFLLRATGSANGTQHTLYSLAGDKGTANINPLSNLVLARAAARGDLAAVYGAPGASGLPAIAGNLGQALSDVQATLKPMLQKYGVAAVNPITDLYKADGTGLDRMFDLVKIELAPSGSVAITDNGAPAVTKEVTTGFTTRAVSGAVTLEGEPFAQVTVSVADQETGTVYGSAQTLSDGSYLINNVGQGSVTVTPAKAGYSFDRANSVLTVAAVDCVVPVFQSLTPYTVSGTVASSNSQGLAGVTVSARRDGAAGALTAVTDGSGKYTIYGLTNGNFTVTPARTDLHSSAAVGFAAASRYVTISATGNYAVANFTADLASFTVHGNVARLAGGAPMAQVAISLAAKNGSGQLLTGSAAVFHAVTDAEGNFSLKGIPNGVYALTPSLNGYAFALLDAFATNGRSADNFMVNGADTRMDFSGRPTSDATGGVIF